jgi:hypothetical protein
MDLFNEIFEFVSGGGHGSGGGMGGGSGFGSESAGRPGAVIVSDMGMGINEIGSEYYGIDQMPTGYRCFDFHRDVSDQVINSYLNKGERIAKRISYLTDFIQP